MWFYKLYPSNGALPTPPPEPPYMMAEEDLADIERLADGATQGTWELQDSNSIRRIGTTGHDGNVMHATQSRHDGVIDLGGPYANLEYIVRMQPAVARALVAEVRHYREMEARRRREQAANFAAADDSAVGRDLDGTPQPYAGSVVLLETIAEVGAVPFVDGQATQMRKLCLEFAAELRKVGRAAGPEPASEGDESSNAASNTGRPVSLTCSRCGSTGIHACAGIMLTPIPPEKLQELDRALDEAEAAEALARGETADRERPEEDGASRLPIRFEAARALDLLARTGAWMKSEIGPHEPGFHVAHASLTRAMGKLRLPAAIMTLPETRLSLLDDIDLLLRWMGQIPGPTMTKTHRLLTTNFLLEWVSDGMQTPGTP